MCQYNSKDNLMGRKKPTGRDDEASASKDKSKKKGFMMDDDDDEYSVGTELSGEEKVAPVVDNEVESCIKEQVVDKEAEEEEGALECAASKKKKKKKKKKAAASENQEDSGKKVAKHVREIQVMLAKLKEAEREEEEERLRQEELDWLAVEKELKDKENAILKAQMCRDGEMLEKYDRKSDPNGPKKHLIKYAQLAIASYNKTNTEHQESQCYTVVHIIQSGKTPCFAGYNVHMDFTAKLCNQDDNDAVIFRARLYEKNRKKFAVVRDIQRKWGNAPLLR